ncbi:hypothetical protein KUCAC02_005388, partial [Chaenocephalus aceratus]
ERKGYRSGDDGLQDPYMTDNPHPPHDIKPTPTESCILPLNVEQQPAAGTFGSVTFVFWQQDNNSKTNTQSLMCKSKGLNQLTHYLPSSCGTYRIKKVHMHILSSRNVPQLPMEHVWQSAFW